MKEVETKYGLKAILVCIATEESTVAGALSHFEMPKAVGELRQKGFELIWVGHVEKIGMGGEGTALVYFVRE